MKHCIVLISFLVCNSSILLAQSSFNAGDMNDVSKANQTLPALITANNMFVVIQTSNNTCFVGQPVLVTYKFYTRLQGQSKVIKMPSFSGCSVQEMTTTDITPEIETYNGRSFKVYTIRKIQLTPLQTGDLILDTASVENTFMVYDKGTTQSDIANGIGKSHDEVVVVHSKKTNVQVKELPLANKPTNFTGAIGNFSIAAKFAKTADTANENNSIKITINGAGNFSNIVCPKIQWPTNIEYFEATTTEDYNKLIFPNIGTITFEIPFVVKSKGVYTIPPIQFSYFDLLSNTYKSTNTDTLSLPVEVAMENLIDENKVSANITNKKYIWIVPGIAMIIGIVGWLKYTKKSNPTTLVDHANQRIEDDEAIIIKAKITVKTNEQLIADLYFFEHDDQLFFSHTKKLAEQYIAEGNANYNIYALKNLVEKCNASLYGSNAHFNKKQLIEDLQNAV